MKNNPPPTASLKVADKTKSSPQGSQTTKATSSKGKGPQDSQTQKAIGSKNPRNSQAPKATSSKDPQNRQAPKATGSQDMRAFYCVLCSKQMYNFKSLQDHIAGKTHQQMEIAAKMGHLKPISETGWYQLIIPHFVFIQVFTMAKIYLHDAASHSSLLSPILCSLLEE